MKINIRTQEELTVVWQALGTASDNEHDKGPEGCGEDILDEIGEYLKGAAEPGEHEITPHVLALLQQYLVALDYEGCFEDEPNPKACEAARAALADRIERFLVTTNI